MNYFFHINLSFVFNTPQGEVYKLLQNQWLSARRKANYLFK